MSDSARRAPAGRGPGSPRGFQAVLWEARGNKLMQEGVDTRGVIHSLRTVGGGAASHVIGAHREPPHMLPQRSAEPCAGYLRASSSAVLAAQRTLAACGVTVQHEGQAQGTAGAARAGQSCAGACRPGATAQAHPVPAARSGASAKRRRARIPAASPEGRPCGLMARSRLRQLVRGVPLRGRRGRGRGPDRLSLTEGEC